MEMYNLHPGEEIKIKTPNPSLICTKLLLKNGTSCSSIYKPLVITTDYEGIDKVTILDLEIVDDFGQKPFIVKERVVYTSKGTITIDSDYHNEYNLKAPKNEQAVEIDYIEVIITTQHRNQEE